MKELIWIGFKNPMIQFVGLLGVVVLGALYFNPRIEVWAHAGLVTGFLILWAALFSTLFKVKKNFWSTLIEAFMLLLLMHPPSELDVNSVLIIAGTTLVVVASRFLILYRKQVIFNPVALGLIVASFFGAFGSWWGMTYGDGFSLIAIGMLVLFAVWKMKKFWLGATFLLLNLVLLAATGEAQSLSYVYTDSTIYFFAGIMLMEPKTSPRHIPLQILSGVLAALFYRAGAHFGLPETELMTIVFVNVLNCLDKATPVFRFLKKK